MSLLLETTTYYYYYCVELNSHHSLIITHPRHCWQTQGSQYSLPKLKNRLIIKLHSSSWLWLVSLQSNGVRLIGFIMVHCTYIWKTTTMHLMHFLFWQSYEFHNQIGRNKVESAAVLSREAVRAARHVEVKEVWYEHEIFILITSLNNHRIN